MHRVEGVILHHIAYGNEDQILTVFTPTQGVLKFFCKKGRAKGKDKRWSPLTMVDIVYKEKQSELFACEEISILHSFLKLRKEFAFLQAGCDLIRTVYMSQMIGRPAPMLYQLLLHYLEKIPLTVDPSVIVASFKLKTLRHEGVLPVDFESMEVSNEEIEILRLLTYSQKYQEIAQVILSDRLSKAIEAYFLELLT